MALALYLDHHMPRAVAAGLRLRTVDVLTAYGVIFTRQLHFSIGGCIDDLEIISQASDLGELDNQILFLPL